MENASFSKPHVDAARLEGSLGTRRAFEEAKQQLAMAIARRDDAAVDHWCEVSLLVVDAWNACPSPLHV